MNWISVLDRLPKLNTQVLGLFSSTGEPIVVWYHEEESGKPLFTVETYCAQEVTAQGITHWIDFKDIPMPKIKLTE